MGRTISRLPVILESVAALTIAVPMFSAMAQTPARSQAPPATKPTAAPAIDNFVHAPGTVTSPLGQLGHVEKRGQGPINMILIAGNGFGWKTFETFMMRNTKRYTMYAITLPGFDGTAPPPMPTDSDFSHKAWLDGVNQAIRRLIDESKIRRPVVVGHYLEGDYLALRLALDQPEKLGGVVVIAGGPTRWSASPAGPWAPATLEERRKSVQGRMAPFYKTVSRETWANGSFKPATYSRDPQRGKELWDQADRVPIPTKIRYLLEDIATDLSLELPNLKAPLLVVNPIPPDLSEEERTRRKQQNQWVATIPRLPTARIEFIDDAGAFVMDDQPETFDKLIADFVAHRDRRSAL